MAKNIKLVKNRELWSKKGKMQLAVSPKVINFARYYEQTKNAEIYRDITIGIADGFMW